MWKMVLMARLAQAEDALAYLQAAPIHGACMEAGATQEEADFIVSEIRAMLQDPNLNPQIRQALTNLRLE